MSWLRSGGSLRRIPICVVLVPVAVGGSSVRAAQRHAIAGSRRVWHRRSGRRSEGTLRACKASLRSAGSKARSRQLLVDELVGQLHETLHALGLATPAPPDDATVLDEIGQAIGPARLPQAARRFWELVDADSLQQIVSFYPQLARPTFSLSMWREDEANEFIGGPPRHLFPFCYESHDVVSVECDGPSWTGGSLFEWFLSDPGSTFKLRYQRVEDWIETLLTALRDGKFQRVGDAHVAVETEALRHLVEAKLAGAATEPRSGTNYEVARDPEHWPRPWRERSGLSL